MSYKLKLDVYQFSLHHITGKRNTRKGATTQFKSEATPVKFEIYAKDIMPQVNQNEYMKTILNDFIGNFDNTFALNDKGTQGVTITLTLQCSFNSVKNTIWGQYKGGTTGIQRDIFDKNQAQMPKDQISVDDVSSVPFFFQLWLPMDYKYGLLFVQSYTNLSCATSFRKELEKYFISKGYKPRWNKCIPADYVSQYLRNSCIKGLRIDYGKLSRQDNVDEGITTPIRFAKRSTLLDHFNIPFKNILHIDQFKQDMKNMLEEMKIDVPQDDNDLKVIYANDKGASATASLSNLESILPNILLSDELLNEDEQFPKWEQLHQFVDGMLEELKKEIGYIPQKL